MAHQAAAGPKFFKGGLSQLCIAVYDTRRGQVEGHEGDKILGFYPPTTSPNVQSSVVGLAQALTMFASTFNQVGPGTLRCPFTWGACIPPIPPSSSMLLLRGCILQLQLPAHLRASGLPRSAQQLLTHPCLHAQRCTWGLPHG